MRYLLSMLVVLLALPATALAKPRPDLVVKSVLASPQDDGSLSIVYSVRNAGRASARATRVTFYLAVEGTRSDGDRLLGSRTIRRLKQGREARGIASFMPPPSAGLFRVIACVDDKRRIAESNETNNCRATTGDVHL